MKLIFGSNFYLTHPEIQHILTLCCLDGRHYVEVNVEILNNCFMASLHALTVTQWIMEPFARRMKSAWCQILDNNSLGWGRNRL